MSARKVPEWVWVLLLALIFVFAETLVGQVHAAELDYKPQPSISYKPQPSISYKPQPSISYGYQEPVAADWSKSYGYQEPPPKRCNIWCRGWRARVEDAATGRGWARGNSGQRIKIDAYGPGIHMDQYGRPVKLVPQ